jgi:hypothetical protein
MSQKIRVKFIGNYSIERWKRQFPGGELSWGNCDFLFDVTESDYDWLVVYNDLPSERLEEALACNRSNTLLITMEPSSIKVYGRAYTAQFGHVLTSQPEWALPHPGRIFSQQGLQWFYGAGEKRLLTYEEMAANPPINKSKNISTVCSSKQQGHTLHRKRYQFTQELKQRLPELDVFGHGVRPMDDKAEALDEYRYHVAIENHVGEHHWTEKLSDAFLGATLPFYYGAPDAVDYFPSESFIPIDIHDVEDASETIRRAIDEGEYEKRLPHILEARRRVLEEFNLFAVLSREIESRDNLTAGQEAGGGIRARRVLRKEEPLSALWDLYDKTRTRILYFFKNR